MTLQEMLGIELPIIQAPMAGVQGSALAIAVSNAGGLGSLPCAMLDLDGIRKELDAIRAATDAAVQRQLLLPSAARTEPGPRAPVARGAGPLLDGTRHRSERDRDRTRTAAVQPRGRRRAGRVQARRRQLPFRPAGRRPAGPRPRVRGEDPVVGDDRRRSPLARGARRGRDHRPGSRSRRTSRDLPLGRSQHADRHARAGAADRAGGARTRDRRRRHRRRHGGGRRAGAGSGRCAGGHGVLAVPGGHDERAPSRGPQERRGARHGDHQCVHRTARARHRQPLDPRAGTDERRRAPVSAGGGGHPAVAGQGRDAWARAISRRCGPGRTPAAARRCRRPS